MIGKSLRERYGLGVLAKDRAVAVLTEMLASQAEHLVQVRAQDARMVACLVVRADKAVVRRCREIGLEIKQGGTAVFGLLGIDAARLFGDLRADQRTWLETPSGPRETKILLLANGIALLSLVTTEGTVAISAM